MLEGFKKLFLAEDWMPARRVLQRDADWWNKLRHDCSVRFGFMPQKELSGKRVQVRGQYLYQFGSGRFVSHQLQEEGKTLCSMIVASAGHNQVYLALSRRLSEREIVNLFSDEERERLPDLTGVNKLYVREHTMGIKEWVTMQYRRQIEGVHGQKTSGDGTRTFRYFLYVNENNDKALEIEWFDDGGYEVYATIYRPISDIVQVWQERRQTPPVTMKAGVRPEAARQPNLVKDTAPRPTEALTEAERRQASAEIIALPQPKKELAAEPPAEETPSSVFAEDAARAINAAEAAVAAEYAQEVSPALGSTPEDENIACNIRVAAKIIDEALRHDMQLADVVRRVLGLPVAISEKVHFHVPLSDRDYHVLAERYGISPADHEAIREHIIEDLIDFTGEREYEARRARISEPA